ncbi:MAG: exopolyphosphatase [Gammaproteobacteria bacterium]|nr:exopolyphosphatase [Gammaproteobacteria bacterium]
MKTSTQNAVPSAAPEQIAAVDLGSNSFHMIIAQMHASGFKLIDRLREQVRLADGLDKSRNMNAEAQERALQCLGRFAQRLTGLPPGNVRVVGTNTLRSAKNAAEFLDRAEQVLGYPIEVVSGIEEARLIYSGVAHSLASDGDSNRLVVDIGGGSTEMIIGRGFSPLLMESLYMGCITHTNRFFPGGKITASGIDRALLEARVELEPKIEIYRERGWASAIGASGTALAINRILAANGWGRDGITLAGLRKLTDAMLKAGDIDLLRLEGLSRERAAILPGGVIILLAVIDGLGIDRMLVSDGALREGLIYDLIGRHHTGDAREASVDALAARYHVDREQAARVESTALKCLRQVAPEWKLDEEMNSNWLGWAARLHELGLDIAHSHYQKHGAYVIAHADLAGFSFQEQQLLASLVLAHRRKFPARAFKDLKSIWGKQAERLALLLRLAAVLHRSRSAVPLPEFRLTGDKRRLSLRLPAGWLDAHPLTRTDLEREAQYLAQIDIALDFG